MFLQHLDLTTALRPSYLPGEQLLFTQDNIGLYEDKVKLVNHQNGQVYLTSHRICYVDYQEPRINSTAINLRDVGRYEFYGGFLKSSPKIVLVSKPPKQPCIQRQSTDNLDKKSPDNAITDRRSLSFATNLKSTTCATWICPICTYSNPVPSDFDPTTANERTPIIPCSTCGVKPPWATVLKAVISNAAAQRTSIVSTSNQEMGPQSDALNESSDSRSTLQSTNHKINSSNSLQCPRCTFQNHPSILTCELCDAPLKPRGFPVQAYDTSRQVESPSRLVETATHLDKVIIKLSFRGGGEKNFLEKLKGSMVQRKWLTNGAPPVPIPNYIATGCELGTKSVEPLKVGGIAGLEARRLHERQKNERVIGAAFEDLEALMASAEEILALAKSFASSNDSATPESSAVADALGLVTTKEMFSSKSESLYITELTRNLVEFLTDDSRAVLKKAGGIITLVDLWARFNRARGGVELVSPNDFLKAARQCEVLKLPLRLREFRSGVYVIQGIEHSDQKVISSIKTWLHDLHHIPPERDVTWDWVRFGHGVTAQEAAERFGWSIGVAEEELELAEEEGSICREAGVEGTRFWINYLVSSDDQL
ncbi:hypothetical protein K3495_g7560 [Podosphaera aphanis]|nr:hypothetical protein K3495_g7560 [Podosphaera aphanis]